MTTPLFVIHHVGARFGNSPFPIPENFSDSVELVLFDADNDCVEGVIERKSAAEFRHRVISACLSNEDGEAEFRLTINPSASSLLEPSEASRGFVQPLFGIDWDLAGCASIVERRRVATRRLDTLLTDRSDIPSPDFLSLDTQGSEFAIIDGAVSAISSGVVGLIVEVEFIDLYERVPRFGAIAHRLEELGFHFAGFRHMIDAHASRQPIGRRSDGFPVAADALFLRRIDSVSDFHRADMLDKLAFASLTFGHLDHAFAAIDAGGGRAGAEASFGWRTVIHRLYEASKNADYIYLPTFPDILPKNHIKHFSREPDIGQWPKIMDISGWRRDIAAQNIQLDQALEKLQHRSDTPVEAVLRGAGFNELAERTNFCRRDQSYKLQQFVAATPEKI